jgi:hypothetical protein
MSQEERCVKWKSSGTLNQGPWRFAKIFGRRQVLLYRFFYILLTNPTSSTRTATTAILSIEYPRHIWDVREIDTAHETLIPSNPRNEPGGAAQPSGESYLPDEHMKESSSEYHQDRSQTIEESQEHADIMELGHSAAKNVSAEIVPTNVYPTTFQQRPPNPPKENDSISSRLLIEGEPLATAQPSVDYSSISPPTEIDNPELPIATSSITVMESMYSSPTILRNEFAWTFAGHHATEHVQKINSGAFGEVHKVRKIVRGSN